MRSFGSPLPLCLAATLATGCAGTHMELSAQGRVAAVDLARIDSTFELKPNVRTELESTVRAALPPVPDSETAQHLVAKLSRERHHEDVTVGGHGDSIDYDYLAYEVGVAIVDAQQHEVGFCRVAWEEPDLRVAKDAGREERAFAAALHKATRALLGDVPRNNGALLATAEVSGARGVRR